MMKLYEFPPAYKEWLKRVEENDGEIDRAREEELAELDRSLSDKVDAYSALIRQFEAEQEAFRTEATFFRDKAGRAELRAQKMKWLLLQALKAMDLQSVRGRRFVVTRRTNAVPTIVWDSPREIPEPFQRIKVELDKTAAAEVLKEMGTLPDGFRVTHTEFVTIR